MNNGDAAQTTTIGQVPVKIAADGSEMAVAAAPIEPRPPRIKTLTLLDFRAFAGPAPKSIGLDGKNLLIYGENGAGKSSIFYAMDEFFSVKGTAAARRDRLASLENIFPNPGKGVVSIDVEFVDDENIARWSSAGHPVDTTPFPQKKADARVVNGAFRKAMLDYRLLLDTNYRHGSDAINLFDVCVNVLLRDYPAVLNGRGERIYDVWRRLEPMPGLYRMDASDRSTIRELTTSLNAALGEAIEALVPKINAMLATLGWGEVKLESLTMPGVQFVWDRLRRNRRLVGRKITPKLLFREKELNFPQTFLNEARLSALALSIYFAGRQLCADTVLPDTPRIMVLDDVLIGLDQSNRLPVLDVLADHFKDWQIVLLTHDRVWFEMARAYHRRHVADKYWKYARVHSTDEATSSPTVTDALARGSQ
jgi:energy-coupling factor transporter ATP-binding protein EcfA2